MKRVLCSLLMIGAVGRVARAGVQRAHRRWGIEGSYRLPPAARPLPGPNGARAGGAPRWRLLGTR